MVLQDYRQIIGRGFAALEHEHLSDEGIAAVCDIRKAAAELYEQAVNYQDALLLLNRLTKSAVDDAHEHDAFSNPFWDAQEASRSKTSDPFSDVEPVKEHPPAKEKEQLKEEVVEEPETEPAPPKRSSVRGSGRIVPNAKVQPMAEHEEPKEEPAVQAEEEEDELFIEPLEDKIAKIADAIGPAAEVEVEKQPEDDFSNMFPEEEGADWLAGDRIDHQFTDVTEEMLRDAEDFSEPDSADEEDADVEDVYVENTACEDVDDKPNDIFSEQGVFEEDELPEYAMSYADDPYLLADDFVENLDDEDMELFIQIGSEEDGISDDIVRPGSLEKSGPKEEPQETPQEAVENARDKFYMPARSRIAMIRGAEPEDYFTGFDLLADGYKKDEPEEEPEMTVPTEDELANAESEFEDEVEEVKEPEETPRPSAVLEKVDPPENEERDEEDPSFDVDQLGIKVDQPLLMSDDEYEKQFRVAMTTTIAEQSAQAEQYMDKFNKLSAIGISSPSVSEDDAEGDSSDE